MSRVSPNVLLFTACGLFLYFALALTGNGSSMFVDTDPLWHIAAGDWIWEHRAIPQTDPWSYTAADYRWLNISWLWDTAFSVLHAKFGWHGAVAVNAAIIGLVIALTYVNCILRSGSVAASALAMVGVITMLSMNLRPLHITDLMTAGWLLLLGSYARRRISARRLALLPVLMLLWVNCHGGLVVGPLLVTAFFLQSVFQKDYRAMKQLFATGVAIGAASMCNPYGWHIIEAVWRPLTTVANQFIVEWQPFIMSPKSLFGAWYAVLFILLVPRRVLPVLPAERWLAYFWLLMSLTSIRHGCIFGIISAPVMACLAAQLLKPVYATKAFSEIGIALAMVYDRRPLALVALLLCPLAALWLPSPMAAHVYEQEHMPIAELNEEMAFIAANYPHTYFLNDFDIGGIILYQTRGAVPVFVDPRTETAFPPQVMQDYLDFFKGSIGWEKIFDDYPIGGVILANKTANNLISRFRGHEGWDEVLTGPHATIFVRRGIEAETTKNPPLFRGGF